jgi:hypothetical protein
MVPVDWARVADCVGEFVRLAVETGVEVPGVGLAVVVEGDTGDEGDDATQPAASRKAMTMMTMADWIFIKL